VEGVLRAALSKIEVRWKAMAFAGATDRGVHAWGQVVSFRARRELELREVRDALALYAPLSDAPPTGFSPLDEALDGQALVARELVAVPRRFHASFGARSRRYRYRVTHDADIAVLGAMLSELRGTRDVRALARQPRRTGTTVKTIFDARVERHGPHLWFDVTASGFLRRQMRVLVATALREAQAGRGPTRLVDLCATGDPRQTAPPAAPGGLCLWEVDYVDEDLQTSLESETSAPSLVPSTVLNDVHSSSPSDEVTQFPSR